MSKNVGNSLNGNLNRSSKRGGEEAVETGTILPITRSIVSIYQNCVTVNMRALPFMRAHRGILVLQVAAILKRGAGVYAKGGERRESCGRNELSDAAVK